MVAADNYVRRALDLFTGYGDREALVATDGRRFSYAQLRDQMRNTAVALWEFGIRPGMTIGVLATNPPESYFVQYGAHLLGCRTVFLAHSTPPFFLRSVLDFVSADAFVYEVAHLGEIGRELAEAADAVRVLCIGAGGLGPDITDPPAAAELPFDPQTIGVEPVSLFQTSGTTGTPKLMVHGQRFFAAMPSVADFYRPPDRPIRHLLMAGTWHAGAQSSALLTWYDGGTIVMNFGFDVGNFLHTIETERITSINVSPPLLYSLLDDPRLAGTDLSSLYQATVAASAAAPTRLVEAIDRFGGCLNVVYGMSELPFITVQDRLHLDPDHPELLGSCGKPWGDVRLEIRDPATGAVRPTGEVGEICLSSAMVTEGYFGSPELTAETLVDGWLRTGDVGRLDEDGNLYIVDRVKDMILTDLGSTIVYCRPLEDALLEHPQVRQAAVVGVPDAFLGEAVHAFVVRAPGATVSEEELRQLVVDRLNKQWSPREVEFVASFPLTEYGKVDKKELRARYIARSAG